MTIKLEEGVPVPPRSACRRPKQQFPFPQMKLNDSFFIPLVGEYSQAPIQAAHAFSRLHPPRIFTTRVGIDPVHNTFGVRVWRIR